MGVVTDRFSTISPADVAPGVADAIAAADRWVDAALGLPDPTFDEAFGRIDHAVRLVRQAHGTWGAMRDLHPDPAVRDAANGAEEAIERWTQGLATRDGVARLVESFAGREAELSPEQRIVLGRWRVDLRDAGLHLDAAGREALAGLREVQFGAPGRYWPALGRPQVVAIRPDETAGLPPGTVDALGSLPEDGAWAVALNDAIVTAVLESAADRGLRERVARAWLRRGYPETRDVLDELTAARRRMAALLGRPSWLALRADRMAIGGIDAREAFLAEMASRLGPGADADREAMRALLVDETGDPGAVVEEWDWRYLDARQRARSGADPDALRDYLPFEACLAGLARLSESVFGVRLEPRPGRQAWHADVRAFDLVDRDTGTLIAWLFVDPFVRDGKAGNAWADVLDPGDEGTHDARPRILLLATNAPAPGDRPSTIALQELDALFHEYGHVLDSALDPSPWVLAREDWERWDWVEGPSLFMGRWGTEPEVLREIGRHAVTGEPIPEAMLASLGPLAGLNRAFRALRWLSMARLDGLLHGPSPVTVEDADARAWAIRGIPRVRDGLFAGIFLHLIGGYDGAIHGFLWDEVLRDDLFAEFARRGLRSPAAGAAYRASVLEAPWTRHPPERVERFLGRPWSSEAFLRLIAD